MRIGIDGRFLNHPESGHGTYSKQLIANLAEIDKKNDYFIFTSPDYSPEIKNANLNYIKTDIAYYSLAEQLFLPKLLKRYNLDLMHFVHFNKPIFYNQKNVVTIHDLTLSHYKIAGTNPIKHFFYKLTIGSAISKSDAIVTISQFTKQEILKNYRISEEKVTVAYEGYSPKYRKITNKSLINQAVSAYNITKPYIIYVGQQRPHKNLVRLITAFSRLKSKQLNYQLVLAGKKNLDYHELHAKIAELKIGRDVIFTDFVPENDLPKLLNGAKLLVFPSLMEGFGLPLLEAFACGIPVACSNTSSLPEVGGVAASYFDPENVENMADTMYKTLTDKKLRQRLLEKSSLQLKKFSWTKMAEKIYKLYQELAN